MAKGFDTLHVKSAVKSHNKFDLSFSHLTTMNFGQIVPLLAEETVAGDKFNVKANYFSRMAPLVKPTYGKFSFNTVTTFVPYYQVCNGIDAYMAGNLIWEGHSVDSRYITFQTLINFIYDGAITTSVAGLSNIGLADFVFTNSAGQKVMRKLTPEGKYYMKILNSLGYQIPQGADLSDTGWTSTVGATKLSALPILAFFKAYNDYMSQAQRFNTSQLTSWLNDIKNDAPVSNVYTSSNHQITASFLRDAFALVKVNYENDYFTTAWQEPNQSIAADTYGTVSSVSIPHDSSAQRLRASRDFNDTYLAPDNVTGGSINVLGQRALDFLKSFDDWVRRNNYSGSRAVQKVYSRFGIKTEDYRSNYAHVIDTSKQGVQVGDITSTSDTTGATLGDYAGKGIMSAENGFSYEAKDYGMLFVFGYYTVYPMMAYGCDRHVLRNSPFDYYNPEFDGLGAEAISYAEIFENPLLYSGSTNFNSNSVFGFTERYNSYRYGRDKITGEFRKLSYSVDGVSASTDWNVWHTGRDLTAVRASGGLFGQASSVNTLSPVNSEYNRIFSITSGDEDKFYLTCQFNVSAVRPMLSLNQVPRLGEGDTVVPRNGNVIN